MNARIVHSTVAKEAPRLQQREEMLGRVRILNAGIEGEAASIDNKYYVVFIIYAAS